jgi:hypothetical protein
MSTLVLDDPRQRARLIAPAPPRTTVLARGLAWPRRTLAGRGPDLPILAGILLVAGVVHATGMSRWPAPAADEGAAMARAWSVLHHGVFHTTYSFDRPPLGCLVLAAWSWVTAAFHHGTPAVLIGRQAMLPVHLACCALVYGVARRLTVSRPWAAVASLLVALSPLAVGSERMVHLDNLALLWLLLAFFLVLSPSRALWPQATAGLCLAGAVLTSATFILLAPAFAYQLWAGTDRRTRPYAVALSGSFFALSAITFPLYVLLEGELWPSRGRGGIFSGLRLPPIAHLDRLFDVHSVAHRTLAGWLHLDPWLLGLGLVAAPFALGTPRLRALGLGLATPAAVVVLTGALPAPFVVGLLAFCALAVAAAADSLADSARRALVARGRRPASRWSTAAKLAAATGCGALAWGVIPAAAAATPRLLASEGVSVSGDGFTPLRQSEQWVAAHLAHHNRLLVDETMSVDLVRAGFHLTAGVESCRSAAGALTVEFDFLVSTPSLRRALGSCRGSGALRLAVGSSRPVITFGDGDRAIEVRDLRSMAAPSVLHSAGPRAGIALFNAVPRPTTVTSTVTPPSTVARHTSPGVIRTRRRVPSTASPVPPTTAPPTTSTTAPPKPAH